MRDNLVYIQDKRGYVGNDVLWWGKGSSGYTADLNEAEVYTLEEALKNTDRETDIFWPFDYINGLARSVVDMQKLNKRKSIKREKAPGT